jgi:hypothetical protein
MEGWTIAYGGIRYVRRGGYGTLPEAWAEVNGVGHATIYRPDGTVYLRDAGAQTVRSNFVRQARLRNRGFGGPSVCGKCGNVRRIDPYGAWCRACGNGAAR